MTFRAWASIGGPLIVASFLLSGAALAQTPVSVDFKPSSGLIIQKDSTFKMNIRFRMQNRFALFSTDGDDLTPSGSDIRVRRMRLRFDGHLFSKRLQYKVQLGFSKADMDLVESTTPQAIRDAVLYYAPDDNWSLGFGQTKLPGNRQRVVSSGALQLPDRSAVNALFTLDRDMGFFATWTNNDPRRPLWVKGAISTGEGRNANPGDEGLCYTGRLEWLPLGAFTNDGDYFEGDLEREQRPKVSIAVGYSTNQGARRAGGQLGEFFPGKEERTLNVLMADVLLKYNGLAWSTEFSQRQIMGEPVVQEEGGSLVRAYEGWGMNTQLSRLVGKKGFEAVARYTLITPSERTRPAEQLREEAWLGCTRYINHHRVKMQAALSYAWRAGQASFDAPGNRWGLWLQMELGI